MADTLLADRLIRQIAVQFADRRLVLAEGIREIDAEALSRGMFQSSVRVKQIHKLFHQELEKRAAMAWECLVRAHRAIGVPADSDLRATLKTLISEAIANTANELAPMLREQVDRSALQNENFKLNLDGVIPNVAARYDVEVDLYVDSLKPYTASSAQTVAPAQQYIFNGPVGAFQTGTNSTANVTQTVSNADMAALLQALVAVQDAIKLADGLSEQKRNELLQVADECAEQVQLPERNETKLQALFTILTTTIQTIPNAMPAYDALRVALSQFGLV